MADGAFKARLRSTAPVVLVGENVSTMRRYQANLRFKADPFPASQMVFEIICYSPPMWTFRPLREISQMPSALSSARLAERMPS